MYRFIPPLIVLVPQDSNATLYDARLLTELRVVYAIVRLLFGLLISHFQNESVLVAMTV